MRRASRINIEFFEVREMRIEDSDWMRAASLVFIAELMLF
jgi:hypothetical protein